MMSKPRETDFVEKSENLLKIKKNMKRKRELFKSDDNHLYMLFKGSFAL